MQLPVQITFRNVPHSNTIEADIHQRVDKLDTFCNRIMACRVAIDTTHHHHQGNLYHIRIDITVPGEELIVNRDPSQHAAHEDIYVAIHDAFDAAHRQLLEYEQRMRGEVKKHESILTGRVIKLVPEEDYGFIEASDGYEIYFHRNSVLGMAFNHMRVGNEVCFVEEQGEKGPQASTVKLINKHVA